MTSQGQVAILLPGLGLLDQLFELAKLVQVPNASELIREIIHQLRFDTQLQGCEDLALLLAGEAEEVVHYFRFHLLTIPIQYSQFLVYAPLLLSRQLTEVG